MNLLTPNWLQQFQFVSYDGGTAPSLDSDGVLNWESGNDAAGALIQRLNRVQGYRLTLAGEFRISDAASAPRIISRVRQNNTNLTATANQETLTKIGQWRRLTCSVVANHPSADNCQFSIAQSGTGAFQARRMTLQATPLAGQFGSGLRGFHVGDDANGALLHPDGTLESWLTVSHDLKSADTSYSISNAIARFLPGTGGTANWSIGNEESVSGDAAYFAGLFLRFRVSGNIGQFNLLNGNPKSTSRMASIKLYARGVGIRAGY